MQTESRNKHKEWKQHSVLRLHPGCCKDLLLLKIFGFDLICCFVLVDQFVHTRPHGHERGLKYIYKRERERKRERKGERQRERERKRTRLYLIGGQGSFRLYPIPRPWQIAAITWNPSSSPISMLVTMALCFVYIQRYLRILSWIGGAPELDKWPVNHYTGRIATCEIHIMLISSEKLRVKFMSYCKFWIYWMGVNTKFTSCHIISLTKTINLQYDIYMETTFLVKFT